MRKSDLKTGHLIERRNGELALVFKDAVTKYPDRYRVLSDGKAHNLKTNYEEDLTANAIGSNKDVVRVYKPTKYSNLGSHDIDDYELVWERDGKPEIEITVKINGQKSKLSDISEKTLLKIRGTE